MSITYLKKTAFTLMQGKAKVACLHSYPPITLTSSTGKYLQMLVMAPSLSSLPDNLTRCIYLQSQQVDRERRHFLDH